MAFPLDWNIIDAFMNLLGLFTVNKDGRHSCTSSHKDEANSSWIQVLRSRCGDAIFNQMLCSNDQRAEPLYLSPAHKPERDSAVNQLMLINNIKHDETANINDSFSFNHKMHFQFEHQKPANIKQPVGTS